MRENMLRTLSIIASVSLMLFSQMSLAILIDEGKYFKDTESNLEWLNFEATFGYSWFDTPSEIGTNEFKNAYGSGWAFATKDQIEGLFIHAGGY